jgi:hypothetical protein
VLELPVGGFITLYIPTPPIFLLACHKTHSKLQDNLRALHKQQQWIPLPVPPSSLRGVSKSTWMSSKRLFVGSSPQNKTRLREVNCNSFCDFATICHRE